MIYELISDFIANMLGNEIITLIIRIYNIGYFKSDIETKRFSGYT